MASGVGKDDNDTDVEVKFKLADYRNSVWFGYFDEGNNQNRLLIPALGFGSGRTFICNWVDEDSGFKYLIDGSIFSRENPQKTNADQANKIQNSVYKKVEFTLTQTPLQAADGERDSIFRYFKGTIDPMSTRIKGKWGELLGEETNFFDFSIYEPVGAMMTLKIGKEKEIEHRVAIDFSKMNILNAEGEVPMIE